MGICQNVICHFMKLHFSFSLETDYRKKERSFYFKSFDKIHIDSKTLQGQYKELGLEDVPKVTHLKMPGAKTQIQMSDTQ